MQIGLSTPAVTAAPGSCSAWEADAVVEDLVGIAVAADAAGLDYLTCSEHIAVPVADEAGRGLTYWDPLSTLAFLAARTHRIRLATAVVVLGYHHPLEIAKRYGTLDRLSGGRLILGVGVGSLSAEFDLLGAPFDGRGERADDMIAAVRASLSRTRPSYSGEFYRYDGFAVQPCAVQARVPIWVGGRTLRSLRRSVRLADGWIPFGLSDIRIAEMLAAVDLPADFAVVLPTGRAIDPLGDPAGSQRRLRGLQALGATAITCTVAAESADHHCRQLAALRDIADRL